MPLNNTKRPGGTSVPGSASVHVWDMLPLHFHPRGTRKLEHRQSVVDPQLLHPSCMAEDRQAGKQPDPASQLDCRCLIPSTPTSMVFVSDTLAYD